MTGHSAQANFVNSRLATLAQSTEPEIS